MTLKTILAFDFGIKSIGIAIGQNITNTATPLGSLKTINRGPDWQQIKIHLCQWQPDTIIIGLPLNMDGTEQSVTRYTRLFANQIKIRFQIPIQFHDERLTTVEARQQLFLRRGRKALTKDNIDSLSAALILESFLENIKLNKDMYSTYTPST
ncbi:MAG: Holliday junction resolvase RuvX [Candidatus Dasytiphilus stammeri]